ncbi:hypothetical protein [Streptomyces poonensis]|uniref:Uncharacterized protein n=1 Tax=Streptomyces poonensis TaxID=68255 RepID=A0A918UFH7_9ACTN|nr:hypothetical protein [Streptomyces poonensis]GGZ00879.1 hypothetical protein GCM10010365_19650 [Streptomyces poonensis]GLJ90421.1 hypothetical protein GCM10017589_30240 [Streptomyces poonensis]
MSGVYEADTAGLRRSIDGMKRLPEMAKGLEEKFRRQENDYTEWPGWTDDFALEVRPRYDDNNRSCTEFSTALFTALDGLVSATLANLDNIEGTRADGTDMISEHARRTGSVFGDGEGDADGSGRH